MDGRTRRAFALAAAAVAILLLAGCVTAPPRAPLMEEVQRSDLSAEEVEYPLFDFMSRFSRVVETAADEIAAFDPDPRVRRHALLWKMNAVAAAFLALEHADASAMVIDLWALCRQMVDYLESGAGRELFGTQQTVAIVAAQGLEAEIRAIAGQVMAPNALLMLKQAIEQWAREHPLPDLQFARASIISLHARLMAEQPSGLFKTVTGLSGQMRDLRGRLTLYADVLPRQVRWQAQLLAEEASKIVGSHVTSAFGQLREERAIVLASIERQRLDTLEVLQAERELILEQLSKERETLVAEMAQLTDEVLDKVEVLVEAQVVNLTNHVQRQRLDTLEFIRSERMALTRDVENIALSAVGEVYDRLWLALAAIWLGLAALLVVAHRLFRPSTQPGGDAG